MSHSPPPVHIAPRSPPSSPSLFTDRRSRRGVEPPRLNQVARQFIRACARPVPENLAGVTRRGIHLRRVSSTGTTIKYSPHPHFLSSFLHHAFSSSFHQPSPFTLFRTRDSFPIPSESSPLVAYRSTDDDIAPPARPSFVTCRRGRRRLASFPTVRFLTPRFSSARPNGSCASTWHGKRKTPTSCEFEHIVLDTNPSIARCLSRARTLDVSLYPWHGPRWRSLSRVGTTLVGIRIRVRALVFVISPHTAFLFDLQQCPLHTDFCADRIGRARFFFRLAHSVSIHAVPPPAPPFPRASASTPAIARASRLVFMAARTTLHLVPSTIFPLTYTNRLHRLPAYLSRHLSPAKASSAFPPFPVSRLTPHTVVIPLQSLPRHAPTNIRKDVSGCANAAGVAPVPFRSLASTMHHPPRLPLPPHSSRLRRLLDDVVLVLEKSIPNGDITSLAMNQRRCVLPRLATPA
ncbi:hypothetical protein B0H14DRAFT_3524633 [Mycena olivaceomarginata]|nr:hypothetical protein B0H14DRAFT_3524633 [Mycena olivaceomarginata]